MPKPLDQNKKPKSFSVILTQIKTKNKQIWKFLVMPTYDYV